MTYRPKIGITMRLEIPTRRFYLGRDYSEALVGAGALPVHIPLIPNKEYIADVVSGLDGILLPGSDTDVDPARFGEQPHPNLGTVIDEKDETDLMVLEESERYGLPVFAICYGMQLLNVFRGGTLIQDINSLVKAPVKHQQGLPLERKSHSIYVEADSLLEKALGVGHDTTNVNSHHHQAIANVGKDLRAIAYTADGVVEAIEDTRSGKFTFGAQWHPEVNWRIDHLSQELFGEFVKAAGSRMVASSNR